MTRLARPLSTLKSRYDAIVVGSGYGGGVSAARLARAGRSVAVLERGREVVTGEFPGRFPDLRTELQISGKSMRSGRPTALFDVRLGADMHVLLGCGLGGGSLINGGVALRPDPRVFADEAWPRQIAQDGLLEEGFRRAERWLRPAIAPRAAEMASFKALAAAGEATGRTTVPTPLAVNYATTINAAGIEQPACTMCGDCCAGCNVGAKNTVALTYLPEAARHGAEMFTEIGVRHLDRAPDGSWRVHARRTDGGGEADVVLEADIVVLAAGTLGSTEILLRSREMGLAVSDRLGMGFSGNGDIIAFGYGSKAVVNSVGVGHPSKVDGLEVGAAVSGHIAFRDPNDLSRELCVEGGILPSAMAPVLPVLFIPNGRLLGAVQSLIKGVYKGPFAHLQTFFAVSHDSASGRFRLEDDRIELVWPGAKDEPVYHQLDAALDELSRAAGGQYVKNPLAGTVMGHQPATAHPLGGCGLGQERADGVVDHKCRVFDARAGAGSAAVHDGLYVIDGAIVPRSLGVNPLLTITALSERAMLHLAIDRGLRTSDEPLTSDAVSVLTPGRVRRRELVDAVL